MPRRHFSDPAECAGLRSGLSLDFSRGGRVGQAGPPTLPMIQLILDRDEEPIDLAASLNGQERFCTMHPAAHVELDEGVRGIDRSEPDVRLEERPARVGLNEGIEEAGSREGVAQELARVIRSNRHDDLRDVAGRDLLLGAFPLDAAHTARVVAPGRATPQRVRSFCSELNRRTRSSLLDRLANRSSGSGTLPAR